MVKWVLEDSTAGQIANSAHWLYVMLKIGCMTKSDMNNKENPNKNSFPPKIQMWNINFPPKTKTNVKYSDWAENWFTGFFYARFTMGWTWHSQNLNNMNIWSRSEGIGRYQWKHINEILRQNAHSRKLLCVFSCYTLLKLSYFYLFWRMLDWER